LTSDLAVVLLCCICICIIQLFNPQGCNSALYTHTTVLQLCGICPGQPVWAGTRRNIHPLTLIVVINHPCLLSPSTIALYNQFKISLRVLAAASNRCCACNRTAIVSWRHCHQRLSKVSSVSSSSMNRWVLLRCYTTSVSWFDKVVALFINSAMYASYTHTQTHTHNHFMALFDFVQDYLGELAPER